MKKTYSTPIAKIIKLNSQNILDSTINSNGNTGGGDNSRKAKAHDYEEDWD